MDLMILRNSKKGRWHIVFWLKLSSQKWHRLYLFTDVLKPVPTKEMGKYNPPSAWKEEKQEYLVNSINGNSNDHYNFTECLGPKSVHCCNIQGNKEKARVFYFWIYFCALFRQWLPYISGPVAEKAGLA